MIQVSGDLLKFVHLV